MISIYGDSILKFVLMENGKYTVSHAGDAALYAAFGQEVRSCAYFGATAAKGLARLQRELEQGKHMGSLCIVEYGGNDCSYRWEEVAACPEQAHEPVTPPQQFVELLREMLRLLRSVGTRPVLSNLVPMIPERYFRWVTRRLPNPQNVQKWLGDLGHLYRWNERYSLLVSALAGEEGVPLLDIRSPFLGKKSLLPLFCEDGIHPNRAGQQLILQALCDFAGREVCLA